MHFGKYLHVKGKGDKGVKGNITKGLRPSNMSGCIYNTRNITIKDTAYIIEREKLRNRGVVSYS